MQMVMVLVILNIHHQQVFSFMYSKLTISDDIDPAQTDDNFPQKNFNAVTYTGKVLVMLYLD